MQSSRFLTYSVVASCINCFATASSAHAGISGVYVESVASNTLENTTLVGRTYKIFLQFDNPADRFINALDSDLFLVRDLYQNELGTDLGPHQPALDPFFKNLAADSYVAVTGAEAGLPSADPAWDASAFASGDGIIGGWFMNTAASNANALDANGRVLVMFLTFTGDNLPEVNGVIGTNNGTNHITLGGPFLDLMGGSIRFAYNPNGDTAGGLQVVYVGFLIPAPGAMGLLGIAVMCGGRRRRGR